MGVGQVLEDGAGGGGRMKPKNFPKRKLLRQMKAQGADIHSSESQKLLAEAREIRTKKRRV